MKVQSEITSDIQSQTQPTLLALNWVGMSQIQSLVQINNMFVPCSLDLGVNLCPGFRGIHMSRLYQIHQDYFLQKPLSQIGIENFLDEALRSQQETSSKIAAKVNFQLPLETLSLKSQLKGFRNYPVQIIFEKKERLECWVQFEILYSSTCPQSASLATEILHRLPGIPDHLPATPHAQRSRAKVKLRLHQFNVDEIQSRIIQIENALGTPVQTAVKKVDEMEFARLNAENLMFCEDAARIVAESLLQDQNTLGFSVYCEHMESLHPHNASCLKNNQWHEPSQLLFS